MLSLKDNIYGVVDLGIVIMIGVAFAALMVISFIIFEIRDMLDASSISTTANNSVNNITKGWDDAVNLLLVAITIFILAIAISALLMLRGR